MDLPVLLPSVQRASDAQLVAVVGTIHSRRDRWSPFSQLNYMQPDDEGWQFRCLLSPTGGRHRDGVYSLRFVVNGNLRRTLKTLRGEGGGTFGLTTSLDGTAGSNVTFRVPEFGEYTIRLTKDCTSCTITPNVAAVRDIESLELNGFVWDSEDSFLKFSERRPGHRMQRQPGGSFTLDVWLKHDGGIDFRHDGVYQFLISVNGDEDQGFAALNDGTARLVQGTGFGSSHGTSLHSAFTIKVAADGQYRFTVDPEARSWSVAPVQHGAPVVLLNRVPSVQLLGVDGDFDPTKPEKNMQPLGDGVFKLDVALDAGYHTGNFALGQELFLDTMALGAWHSVAAGNRISGYAWHGKPNEFNIPFRVRKAGRYAFTYDTKDDSFVIEALDPGSESAVLEPVARADSVYLVGEFDPPLVAWSPSHVANRMEALGGGRHQRVISLQEGRAYQYKYCVNGLPWLMALADYELDGYGSDFAGRNPNPFDNRLEDLRRWGALTSHGNPPPLQFTADHDGLYRFTVDLVSGAYSVWPLK